MTAPADYETAMTRLKKTVYKTRMRLRDFFVDFDRLNTGYVYPNHFLSALSMAGEQQRPCTCFSRYIYWQPGAGKGA